MDNAKTNDNKLFKFILKCCRNYYKPDVHSFFIDIRGGKAFVECDQYEVRMTFYLFNREEPILWCGTPVAAANRLEANGAVYETIDM